MKNAGGKSGALPLVWWKTIEKIVLNQSDHQHDNDNSVNNLQKQRLQGMK